MGGPVLQKDDDRPPVVESDAENVLCAALRAHLWIDSAGVIDPNGISK